MKMKLFSVLLALLVCLSMVVFASATAEHAYSFTLESSDSSVEGFDALVTKPGDTISVTVNLDTNTGLLAAQPQVVYDAKVLELQKVEAVEGVVYSGGAGTVVLTLGDPYAALDRHPTENFEVVSLTGKVATLTFKVLSETDVQSAVELKVKSSYIMNADGNFSSTVSGDKLAVHVVGPEHECDPTKTVEANNAVEPTCTEAGKATDLLCAHCGAVVTEGEEIAALGHAWDEGVVTTAPTCTVPGVLTHTCGTCGETKEGEPVPATGHAWDEGVITTEPGCSSLGVRTFTCTSCGETKLDEHVPATGEHTYGEWVVKTEPTTEAEGLQVRTCSECGAEESEVIEKLPEAKSNVLLIVIIVVVVLAGAGVAAYFVLKNKKK